MFPDMYEYANIFIIDTTLFPQVSEVRFGCVLRDSSGAFLGPCSKCQPSSNLCPLLAEACGVREALSWLKELQVQDVDLEVDVLCVINAINSYSADLSPVRLIISDCISFPQEMPTWKSPAYRLRGF